METCGLYNRISSMYNATDAMAASKTHAFTSRDAQLSAWAKALSHPARLMILRLLAARNACMCGDIVDELPLAQATVSQHLKVLKDAGFICGEIDGVRVCYCLNGETLYRCLTELNILFEEVT